MVATLAFVATAIGTLFDQFDEGRYRLKPVHRH